MPKLKLTKTVVDKLPYADKGKQIDYWDTELKGFGCRVSASSKTYFVMKRINGKQSRISLGRHGVIKTDKARDEGINTLAQINDGVDVNREKAKTRVRGITLEQVYEEYLGTRPQMKSHTIRVDKSLLKCHLSDWKNKPIQDIARDMVAKRHTKIAQTSGKVTANNAMRFVRRVYNFALSASDGELPPNPVQRLSDSRQWFKVERRQTVLKEHELFRWYAAVQGLDNPTIRDYLLVLLFTGLRKNEALKMTWKNVDMTGKSFAIPITKSGKPHSLPMSDILFGIFEERLRLRENDYVFPSVNGKIGHLVEPKRQVEIVKEKTGISFCLHDLRRTFASIAESIVSYSALKRLLNHTDKDVTQGYIIFNIDKLRGPVQVIAYEIDRLVKNQKLD
jgi:integrase